MIGSGTPSSQSSAPRPKSMIRVLHCQKQMTPEGRRSSRAA
jgi:hypothetical protein